MSDKVPFGWVITEDHLAREGEEPDIDHVYPENADAELIREKGKPFRLLDDDGELYYTGSILIPEDDGVSPKFIAMGREWEDDWEGHPLRWAQSYAGCTEIQYKNDKDEWESYF